MKQTVADVDTDIADGSIAPGFNLDRSANELLYAAARATLIECRVQWQIATAAVREAEAEVEAAYQRTVVIV